MLTSQASVYFEEAEKTSLSQKKVFFILVFTEKSLNPVDFKSLLGNLIFKNNFNLNFCSKIAPKKKQVHFCWPHLKKNWVFELETKDSS